MPDNFDNFFHDRRRRRDCPFGFPFFCDREDDRRDDRRDRRHDERRDRRDRDSRHWR